MDTAIIVGVIIGSVVAMVLVFAKTVLGVAWTGNASRKLGMTQTKLDKKNVQEYSKFNDDAARKEIILNENPKEEKEQLTQVTTKSSNIDSLLNKEVYTCDHIIIGSIYAVHNGLMIITYASQGKRYEIPTYYVRECKQEGVMVDISASDLEYYVPRVTI